MDTNSVRTTAGSEDMKTSSSSLISTHRILTSFGRCRGSHPRSFCFKGSEQVVMGQHCGMPSFVHGISKRDLGIALLSSPLLGNQTSLKDKICLCILSLFPVRTESRRMFCLFLLLSMALQFWHFITSSLALCFVAINELLMAQIVPFYHDLLLRLLGQNWLWVNAEASIFIVASCIMGLHHCDSISFLVSILWTIHIYFLILPWYLVSLGMKAYCALTGTSLTPTIFPVPSAGK